MNNHYNLISMGIAFAGCGIMYLFYEKKEGSIRRMVVIAVMTTMAVLGRFVFAAIPFFQPVTAVVTLSGIFLGPQCGFLVGSLAALVSNIFFGQGPWTPFQMMAWGLIGTIAGLPFLRKVLTRRGPLVLYGIFAGCFYSFFMDIWTVLSLVGGFNLKQYLVALGTAVPVTATYVVSNVVFLMLTIKPVGEKLKRLQIKHGIF